MTEDQIKQIRVVADEAINLSAGALDSESNVVLLYGAIMSIDMETRGENGKERWEIAKSRFHQINNSVMSQYLTRITEAYKRGANLKEVVHFLRDLRAVASNQKIEE